jgi:hypothetical protein
MPDDQPRPAATSRDTDFSLSIDEVIALYAAAGLPRDRRTIQRYCSADKLDCRKIEIPFGEQYVISPASVERHIAYIKELRQAAANRGEPRHVVGTEKADVPAVVEVRPVATSPGEPRPTAAEDDAVSRYVARVEGENEFLRGQIAVKDDQIKDLTERARETNHLIAGLQKMLSPLLGRGSTGDNPTASQ